MDLVVVGSIPTRHPFLFNAPVAHLDRATDFESVGRRFESSQTQQKKISLIRYPVINKLQDFFLTSVIFASERIRSEVSGSKKAEQWRRLF